MSKTKEKNFIYFRYGKIYIITLDKCDKNKKNNQTKKLQEEQALH